MLAKMRGYPLKIVLPENVSEERKQLLEVWGAEIIPSPAAEGSNGAMRRAEVLAAEHPDWFFPFQYGNPANPKAHYESTGPEIWRDVPEITHFVAGLGHRRHDHRRRPFLKERNPDIEIWAIEPPVGEMVDGLKNFDEGFVPPVFVDGGGADLLIAQDHRRGPRVDRVGAPAHRGRRVRRHQRRGDRWPARPSAAHARSTTARS